jgi:hypothetical protein
MATRSSVTSTHCSIHYKVTSRVNHRVRADASYIRADALKRLCGSNASVQTRAASFPLAPLARSLFPPFLPRVHANAVSSPRGRSGKKKKKLFLFFGSCCRLEKKRKNFGFQSPRSPSSPSSAGFASEAARRRRFFWPSSPSHPSKLYSSLGSLNSKVPKPFFPFIVRLIDVDGF